MVSGMIATTSGATAHDANTVVPRLRTIDLAGPAGRLEAVLNEGSSDSPFAALLCHPHPLGGGTMHNKVVYHAMKALNAPEWGLGWPVLRFNFRGTGLSEGIHDGEAESDDVLAALRWLGSEFAKPIVAVGFSFGAAMTFAAAGRAAAGLAAAGAPAAPSPSPLRAIVALGLPLRSGPRTYEYPFLAQCHLPKLFVSGDHDQFAPAANLESVVNQAAPPRRLALIPGADHFFSGQLTPMQSIVSGWLKELS